MAAEAEVSAGAPRQPSGPRSPIEFVDLGRLAYRAALEVQRRTLAEAVEARDAGGWPGRVYVVEHDPPVVTVTKRPGVAEHLLASPERLAALGVQVEETDRGGDITWHGPGQLVVYPILDLNALGLRIHGYMRFLEETVIGTLAAFGVSGERDPGATGVWVPPRPDRPARSGGKICALGVRVSRWISMHGLALNVQPDLRHFELIVPCGLHGRPVTSLERELGPASPSMIQVKEAFRREFDRCAAELRSDEDQAGDLSRR